MIFSKFGLLGLGFIGGFVLLLLLLAILIFEIAMFVHTIRNHSISQDRKLLWLVGMILLHPFIAIAYYFTDYQKKA